MVEQSPVFFGMLNLSGNMSSRMDWAEMMHPVLTVTAIPQQYLNGPMNQPST